MNGTDPAFTEATPRHAMVLAAGLGLRMRPLSAQRPKPLIAVAGRTLLDRVLDRLEAFGVADIVVNAHYLADQIADHVASRGSDTAATARSELTARSRFMVSVEAERLETGGGIALALPLLGEAPFFVVNGDVLWLDGQQPTLDRLAAAWDETAMDALLLMQSTQSALGYDGEGDFLLADDGRLRRRPKGAVAPYLFAGIQILSPRLFSDAPVPPFSLNVLYDRAAASGRLFGIVHHGRWFHVGTPADLALAEVELARLDAAAREP